jgi:hypothetical protein
MRNLKDSPREVKFSAISPVPQITKSTESAIDSNARTSLPYRRSQRNPWKAFFIAVAQRPEDVSATT